MIVAVLATDGEGKLRPTARRTLGCRAISDAVFPRANKAVLVVVPRRDEAQQRA